MARSYHKRINLTNESHVGQLINIMGPPIPGRGVPRIDVFFAGNDFYFELPGRAGQDTAEGIWAKKIPRRDRFHL